MRRLEDLNFHHLLYFWTVAKEGGVTAASERLNLTQPSVSMQLRKLERAVGGKLFRRAGRKLALTDLGQEVFRHAEQIFAAGEELVHFLEGRPSGRHVRLTVGVPDIMPKLITYRLLTPVFHLAEPMEVICYESAFENLLADLAVSRFDVILSDAPISSRVKVRAFNHPLGECGITIVATAPLARRFRGGFPQSLSGAPMLLPTPDTELRRSLDQWFDARSISPRVVGQFYDSALLKEFGHAGIGLFPAPMAIEAEVQKQYRVQVVGQITEVREKFYAITPGRQIKHPGVLAIAESAKRELLA